MMDEDELVIASRPLRVLLRFHSLEIKLEPNPLVKQKKGPASYSIFSLSVNESLPMWRHARARESATEKKKTPDLTTLRAVARKDGWRGKMSLIGTDDASTFPSFPNE